MHGRSDPARQIRRALAHHQRQIERAIGHADMARAIDDIDQERQAARDMARGIAWDAILREHLSVTPDWILS